MSFRAANPPDMRHYDGRSAAFFGSLVSNQQEAVARGIFFESSEMSTARGNLARFQFAFAQGKSRLELQGEIAVLRRVGEHRFKMCSCGGNFAQSSLDPSGLNGKAKANTKSHALPRNCSRRL